MVASSSVKVRDVSRSAKPLDIFGRVINEVINNLKGIF